MKENEKVIYSKKEKKKKKRKTGGHDTFGGLLVSPPSFPRPASPHTLEPHTPDSRLAHNYMP
jgi:hypothetical protein